MGHEDFTTVTEQTNALPKHSVETLHFYREKKLNLRIFFCVIKCN